MSPNKNLLHALRNNDPPRGMDLGCFLIPDPLIIKDKKLLGINFGRKYLHQLLILKVLQGTHGYLLKIGNIHKVKVFTDFQTQKHRGTVSEFEAQFWGDF